ncbi:MAG: GGDEF domain-containing protein [Lachnospiraceae bacterium]|nr:GGDEF domain-containing protein [Lachnospiraceae bacterium]
MNTQDSYKQLLKKWADQINRLNFNIMIFLFIIEVAFMYILYQGGEVPSIRDYAVRFIFRPTIVNALVFAVTSWFYHASKSISDRLRAFMPLITFLILVANIIFIHYIFPVLYALIFVPVFISIVYGDEKITKTLALISALVYLGDMIGVYITRSFDLPERFWLQVIICFAIMPLVSQLAVAITRYERDKELMLIAAGEKNDELREEVLYDGLTRIYNYAGISEVLSSYIDEAVEHPKMLLHMAILDIDFFKQVNDTFGHESGNVVLKRLGSILSEVSSNQIIVGRYGGEEYIVVFTDMPKMNAKLVLNDIFVRFSAEEYPETNIDRHITFSAGLASYKNGESMGQFVKRADAALYEAKENGRRQIRVAED